MAQGQLSSPEIKRPGQGISPGISISELEGNHETKSEKEATSPGLSWINLLAFSKYKGYLHGVKQAFLQFAIQTIDCEKLEKVTASIYKRAYRETSSKSGKSDCSPREYVTHHRVIFEPLGFFGIT